jgi:hypothetical protein
MSVGAFIAFFDLLNTDHFDRAIPIKHDPVMTDTQPISIAMTDQGFDIANIGHARKRRDGITHLALMNAMQFQELLNGLRVQWMLFMEEYKFFIRFANLYLYFSGEQSTTVVSMLREKPPDWGFQAMRVGEVRTRCRKKGKCC